MGPGSAEDVLALIRRTFAAPRPPAPLPPGAAAVLAPVVPGPGGPHLLLERRPPGPSVFAGQLGFPGGRIEPDDASPLAAALREAEEEIGFRAGDVEVVGHLTEMDNHLGRRVTAFVGIVDASRIPAAPASPAEVAEILLVPLAGLRSVGKPRPRDLPPNAYWPAAYESRVVQGRDRPLHYWTLEPPPAGSPAVLWGLTGEMVARMLRALWGWDPPSAPRGIPDWAGLRP